MSREQGYRSDLSEVEAERLQNLTLHTLDKIGRVGVCSDLNVLAQPGRVYLFVLACDPEASDAHELVLLLRDGPHLLILVEVEDGQLDSLLLEPKGLVHIHQPVHHNLPHLVTNLTPTVLIHHPVALLPLRTEQILHDVAGVVTDRLLAWLLLGRPGKERLGFARVVLRKICKVPSKSSTVQVHRLSY
jgi:hypothetical protein